MPSDPSYGPNGFFSFLWVKRRPVYDNTDMQPFLASDDSVFVLTDDSGANILVPDTATSGNLYRWI